MTPLNYLTCAAKHAKALKSNYVIAGRDGRAVFQGADLREAKNLDGVTLYFFCEPGLSELSVAAAARVEAIYYGISKHDALRQGLFPVHLRPQVIQRIRRTILDEYAATWKLDIRQT